MAPDASKRGRFSRPLRPVETADARKIVMEVPGVPKDAVDVKVENEVLRIEGRIETTNYNGLEPLYTEYPIGHFARSFTLPWQVDRQNITAHLEDGVLTLTRRRTVSPIRQKFARLIQTGISTIRDLLGFRDYRCQLVEFLKRRATASQ
ncbi:MAG TPA: Hsp20/alpha crystallin family protein [Bradyrhizobium sp.]|nr:Hsp20/alpha crystallin family protein [Bradyrhizobium sp.]